MWFYEFARVVRGMERGTNGYDLGRRQISEYVSMVYYIRVNVGRATYKYKRYARGFSANGARYFRGKNNCAHGTNHKVLGIQHTLCIMIIAYRRNKTFSRTQMSI